MKAIRSIIILTVLASSLPALPGQKVGNGGGGLYKDGHYVTFGSAKVHLTPVPATNVPGLALIKTALQSMPLPHSTSYQLLAAVLPMGDRAYYRIDELNPDARKQLVRAYAKALGKNHPPLNEIAVYALTKGHETYLLPEFYQLQETGQASLLFHEAEWVLNPKLSYREVIEGELRFQNYLESQAGTYGFNSDVYWILDRVLGTRVKTELPLTLLGALADDLNSGRLNEWLDLHHRLPLSVLVPGEEIHETAVQSWEGPVYFGEIFDYFFGGPDFGAKLMQLSLEYPQMKSFPILYALRYDLFLNLLSKSESRDQLRVPTSQIYVDLPGMLQEGELRLDAPQGPRPTHGRIFVDRKHLSVNSPWQKPGGPLVY